MATDRFQALLGSKLIADIRKSHGANILTVAAENRIRNLPRVSTGIFFLDYALGGGFPVGRNNIVWGHKSTGKTVICLKTMANAQRQCGNCYAIVPDGQKCVCKNYRETVCAFLDTEGSWTDDWARFHGVNPERVLLSVPEYAEQTLDIAEALLRTGELDFLVIDSLAFLTPASEIKESTGKALQAEQARVLGRGIRKFVAALNWLGNRKGRRPTILCTNQIRMKVGLLFGNPETQPGGHAPGFSATTEIKTSGGKYEMDEITGLPLHVDLKFKTEKNKSFGAKVEGEWRLMLADTDIKKKGEVYEEPAMVEMGIKLGLVEKEGNKLIWQGNEYKSKTMMSTALIQEPELRAAYTSLLMQVLTA